MDLSQYRNVWVFAEQRYMWLTIPCWKIIQRTHTPR